MSKVREAINNTLAVVAETVPTTVYNGNKAFRVLRRGKDARSDAAVTRQVSWSFTDELTWAGDMTSQGYTSAIVLGLSIEISYPTPDDLHELHLCIIEDLTELAKALVNPGRFEANTTGIWQRNVQSIAVDDGRSKGDTTYAILTLTIQYSAE